MTSPTPVQAPDDVIQARISHYWPPLGGVNCFLFVDGECISRMASGERWQDWTDRAAACPPSFPFYTTFYLPDGMGTWVCLDRGGSIITLDDGTIWLDLLTMVAPVPFGTVVTVEYELP